MNNFNEPYRFSHMTVTVIHSIVFDMIFWNVNDRERILALCLVLALTRLSKTEDSIRTI